MLFGGVRSYDSQHSSLGGVCGMIGWIWLVPMILVTGVIATIAFVVWS